MWCHNLLVVTGDDAEIARFREAAFRDHKWAGRHLSFDAFVPMPKEIREAKSDIWSDLWLMALGHDRDPSRSFESRLETPLFKTAGIATRGDLAAELDRVPMKRLWTEVPSVQCWGWKTAKAEAERQVANLAKHGCCISGEWQLNYWGTNCGDIIHFEEAKSPGGVELRFKTVSTPPVPVVNAMGEAFPKLRFDLTWEDEETVLAESREPMMRAEANEPWEE